MAAVNYTGNLTDAGVYSLGPLNPRLTVRPEIEAWGPDGPITDNRKNIALDGTSFTMPLTPSNLLVGTDGRVGVKYILEVVLFAETADGSSVQVWHSEWKFTALPNGEMSGDVPPLAFYVGPPWPSSPRPGGYFDTETGDLGHYGMEVN